MIVPEFNDQDLARDVRRMTSAIEKQLDLKTHTTMHRRVFKTSLAPFHRRVQNSINVRRGALRKSVKVGTFEARKAKGLFFGTVGYVATSRTSKGWLNDHTRVTGYQILAYEFGTKQQRPKRALTGAWDAGGRDQVYQSYSVNLGVLYDEVFEKVARDAHMKLDRSVSGRFLPATG